MALNNLPWHKLIRSHIPFLFSLIMKNHNPHDLLLFVFLEFAFTCQRGTGPGLVFRSVFRGYPINLMLLLGGLNKLRLTFVNIFRVIIGYFIYIYIIMMRIGIFCVMRQKITTIPNFGIFGFSFFIPLQTYIPTLSAGMLHPVY